jgi:hypothetical protein
MMAIELRDRLQVALDERLAATIFFAHPTVDALAERLLETLDTPPGDEPAPEPAPAQTAGPDEPDHLSTLDEDDLAAQLAAELAALGRADAR